MSNDNPDYTTRLSNSLDELPKKRSVIDPSLLAIDLSPWEKLDARKHRLRCETHPFAQPYRDPTKHNHEIPQWQRDMARWCNNKALFTHTDFRDYEPRKGFKCREYEKH